MPDAPPGEPDQNQEQAQPHDDHPHEGEVSEEKKLKKKSHGRYYMNDYSGTRR